MEEVLLRFPHLGEQIFLKLFHKSLVKCTNVSKTWYHFIINAKIYKLQARYENFQKDMDQWKNTPLHKAAENGQLSECQLIVSHVEKKNPENFFGDTPLHVAAEKGHLPIHPWAGEDLSLKIDERDQTIWICILEL